MNKEAEDINPLASAFEAAGIEVVGYKEQGGEFVDLSVTKVMNISKHGKDTYAVDNNFIIYHLKDDQWVKLDKVENWKIEE
jgi:hypothetical protein